MGVEKVRSEKWILVILIILVMHGPLENEMRRTRAKA